MDIAGNRKDRLLLHLNHETSFISGNQNEGALLEWGGWLTRSRSCRIVRWPENANYQPMQPALSYIHLLAQAEGAPTQPGGLRWAGNILWETLTDALADLLERLPYLAVALIVVGATFLIAKIARRAVGRVFSPKRYRHSLQELMQRFAVLVVWAIGLLVASMIVFPGLNFATALGAAGLLSVAVGFAFKDIFENFFAGVLLLWRFPFENGDFIECEDIVGRVVDTQLRMTLVRQTSGELTVVPNAMLITSPVEILTHEKSRRVQFDVGVAYDVDVPTAVRVIQEAIESCGKVFKNKPIGVFPKGFGESSIDIEVLFWTGSTPTEMREARAEAVTAIKKALDDNNLEIPFPYRTLTFKEALPIRRHRESGGSNDAESS